jgi:hypothetical protein
MLFMNQHSHIAFLTRELKKFLPDGSFSSRLWQAIGAELQYRLMDWPDESETEYSSFFPVDALFLWATKDGGLDPGWLADEDGNFFDNDGALVPRGLKAEYSAEEQLAAYGLWLVHDLFESTGSVPEDEFNEQGWTSDQIIEHQAACMLLAYQALSYSQRVLRGTQLSAEEKDRAAQINFSELGKAGAKKRHAPMAELRTWAIKKYHAGEWKSANHAAHSLKDSIIQKGRTINAFLTEENAQRTIAEWFRKPV